MGRKRKDNLATYRLVFPAQCDARQVQAWLHMVSGRRLGPFRMVIETWGSRRGITHRLRVPHRAAETVIPQLRALVPGMHARPEALVGFGRWDHVLELGESRRLRELALPDPAVLSAGLLACLQLSGREEVLFQWVVSPARPDGLPRPKRARRRNPWHPGGSWLPLALMAEPEVSRERRAKLAEPHLHAVLRIAASSESPGISAELVSRLVSALSGVDSRHNRFRPTWSLPGGRRKRIKAGAGMCLYPAMLPVSDLTGLLAWPIGSPHVAGLPRSRTRQLPPPAAIPSDGAVFATASFPGAERPLAISEEDACKHLEVIGPPGVGKTTLCANLAAQWMERGAGVVILESKGDLFHAALASVPVERKHDVIVVDIDDPYPVGFNVLDQANARSGVDELSALITTIYGDSGVYTPLLLYHGLHALAETPGCTFVDLPAVLTPQNPEEAAWREWVVDRLHNKEIRLFWQRYLNERRTDQDRMSAPVHNRIWQFTVRPEVRNILGQSSSSFSFEDVVRNNRIVLINLNGVRVGARTAGIMGSLLISALWRAARTVSGKHPTFLFLDEFQDFLTLMNLDAADLLAKARSFRLPMVLAHQFLGQLPLDLRSAVLSNARTKVVFQTSFEDARTFVREFGSLVDDQDFMNLGPYEVIARVATADGVSPPVTGVTLRPRESTGLADEIRAISRQRYGRPAEDVAAEILARRRPPDGSDGAKRRPRLSE